MNDYISTQWDLVEVIASIQMNSLICYESHLAIFIFRVAVIGSTPNKKVRRKRKKMKMMKKKKKKKSLTT